MILCIALIVTNAITTYTLTTLNMLIDNPKAGRDTTPSVIHIVSMNGFRDSLAANDDKLQIIRVVVML